MKLLDLTYPSPEENLACDEALLDACEHSGGEEILRFWEPAEYFVVLGYSNRGQTEVNLRACRERNIPLLRRYSGGGTVLQGPGCLNYAVVLPIRESGPHSTITGTGTFVMTRHRDAIRQLVPGPVEVRGHSDLALNELKFSGNAQRRRERSLLFHGTFLLSFNIRMVDQVLRPPSKQPTYRKNRSHGEFLTNLHLPSGAVKRAIQEAWNVSDVYEDFPLPQMENLVHERYARPEWNFRM